jgi:phosphoribosylformylglycinamidine (FGAM) synthase-like amidotransferase family enzyme
MVRVDDPYHKMLVESDSVGHRVDYFLRGSIESHVQIQSCNLRVKEAVTKELILSSKLKRQTQLVKNEQTKLKIVQSKLKIVQSKLKMLEKMKDFFVEHNGEDKYKEKKAALLEALLDAERKMMIQITFVTEKNDDDNNMNGSVPELPPMGV